MATCSQEHEFSLHQLLTLGWDVQKKIESGELVSTTEGFKVTVDGAIKNLREAQRRVEELDMFSKNEEIDEISTNDMKYFLLPALLGDLVYQVMNEERLSTIKQAQIYFTQYLQRCQDYAITSESIPNLVVTDDSKSISARKTMDQLSAERQAKISRLKSQKETEKKLKELSSLIHSSEHNKHVDEEILRDHTLTLLNVWVYKSIEYLHTIGHEVELLQSMEKLSCSNGTMIEPSHAPPKPSKPLVITKDMLKNKVFGAGYPSLPTMTVEEFYEQQYKYQQTQDPQTQNTKQLDNDEEDDKKLRKEREFDEYKDDHRRGWGNRKNKG